jgi:two-component system, OmpR family, sensor histidine kinase KdpD
MPRRGRVAALAGSIGAVAVCTGLVYALRPVAPVLSLGVLYVLAVLFAAIAFGSGYAISVAVVSMLAFNFFFLPPLLTLALADGRNWTALGVYVATALIAGELATRARRRTVEAEQRGREAALLSDAAAELLEVRDVDVVLADLRVRADRVLRGADDVARGRFEAAFEALVSTARQRNRLEREAHDAEALRRSDLIKTAVLQVVSHDFRTPLATMTAAVGGLESKELELSDEDRAGLLETIRLEVVRLTRLVTNLLDLSRLQAGAAAPHPELWAVDDLVAQALEEVGEPERVQVEIPAGLPPARVDAAQLQRVLVNLVENGLKFSGGGTVTVRASGAAPELTVEVLDRGKGIEGVDAATLLEPFERGRIPTGAGGAGLGLAIARGFATANGGSVVLESRPGGGTCARLTIPAESLPVEAAP